MSYKFRCSDLDRILSCSGSITLVPMVAPRQGDEGAEGTGLHFLSAARIVKELGATTTDGFGVIEALITIASPRLRFSEWISDYYVRHVRENVPQGWSLECEVALAYEFDDFTLSGHIDCCAVSPDGREAMGWDLKTGYDPVDEAEQNWQMLGYIVLLKRAYPQLRTAQFFVVQPRNDEEEGYQRVTQVRVGATEEFKSDINIIESCCWLESRINQAIRDRFTVTTSRTACKWCPAAMSCPAAIAERDLMKITLTPEHLAAIKATPEDTTLADWVLASRILARPIEDATALAKERIAATGAIVASDGTEISVKTSAGSYKVTDPVGLWGSVKELLPEGRMAMAAKWSMTALKDQIAEHMDIPVSGKASVNATTVFDAKLRTHVEQGKRETFQFK